MANPIEFAPPLHHTPSGPTDPSLVILSKPFTVLIAGGSRGIGFGIAKSYAIAGASSIIISARSSATLATAASKLSSLFPTVEIHTFTCDNTSESSVQDLLAFTKKIFGGRLDVLVISAGTSPTLIPNATGENVWPFGVTGGTVGDFNMVIDVNMNGPFLLMHYFIPMLEECKEGMQTIVQLSSAAASYVNADMMAMSYSLSKFAVTRLVEHCMEGHGRNGVCAYALQPGGVKTELGGSVPSATGWEKFLIDDVMLAGGFCVWLTKEKREWLSGRYVDSRWDIEELERRKEEIVQKDLLKFRITL